MKSRQIRILLISLLVVFAISAGASASSASATCYRVVVAGTGHWEKNTCSSGTATKNYVEVETLETAIKVGEWCAKVKAGEPSTYENNTCTTTKTGTGEYTKVYVPECFRVVTAGTGTFAKPSCEGAAGTEYIRVSKLETELKPGEWCAKVRTAKTGKYSNATCTEEKTGATEKEYIKVFVPFWQVCEKTGSEEYETHKCVKKGAGGEWSWTKLAAGNEYPIASKGGEQKLVLNTSPQIIITCTAVKDKGNIKGGSPGTDEVTELEYTGCTINIIGCLVVKTAGAANGTIVVPPPLYTELFEEGTAMRDRVYPATPPTFVVLEIGKKETGGKAEEACGVLAVKDEVKGTAVGRVEGENLKFEGEGTLTVDGFEAKLYGLDEQEITGTDAGWAFRAEA